MKYNPIEIARQFLFVRELPGNHGLRVNAIQKWGGGNDGDSWCCWFATMVLDIAFQGNSPIPRQGSCQAVLELAHEKGWLTDDPQPNDLFLLVDGNGHAHHIGFVEENGYGIAGNTSADGRDPNGTGVFKHMLNLSVPTHRYVHYPR